MNLQPSTSFSGTFASAGLSSVGHASALHAPASLLRGETSIDDVELRHLVTPEQIKQVMHLREENLDLSVHAARAAAGPDFYTLEKKETSWGTFLHSSFLVN